MTAVCLWALCGVGGFVFYTYLGYPLLLMILAAVRRRHPPVAPLTEWPRISIVLPAYNEEAVIRDTLERSEEHTSELQSLAYLVCRLLLEKKKKKNTKTPRSTRDDTQS